MTTLSRGLSRRYRDWSVLELCKLFEERWPCRPLARVSHCRVDLLQRHGWWRSLIFIVRIDHHSQVSLGEMVSYLPVPGGHIKLAERFVNGAFSFVCDPAIWS
jgi:hypothetical protein